jgi:hypothetical protein
VTQVASADHGSALQRNFGVSDSSNFEASTMNEIERQLQHDRYVIVGVHLTEQSHSTNGAKQSVREVGSCFKHVKQSKNGKAHGLVGGADVPWARQSGKKVRGRAGGEGRTLGKRWR